VHQRPLAEWPPLLQLSSQSLPSLSQSLTEVEAKDSATQVHQFITNTASPPYAAHLSSHVCNHDLLHK
jgi:hypothetical protein